MIETTTGELLSERIRMSRPVRRPPKLLASQSKRSSINIIGPDPSASDFQPRSSTALPVLRLTSTPAFIGLPVADYFSRQTGCPVQVANDADVAGLAEMRFGAAKDTTG